MTYKQALTHQMVRLARYKRVVFIGYNTLKGHQMNGTLKGCEKSCLEMPVAENLMTGVAMGMSLEGYFPILCFERHDFLLIALDAIINHLDKLPKLSGGQFAFPLVIRAIIGDKFPLDPGPQHTQDFTELLQKYTSIEIYQCFNLRTIEAAYSDLPNITEPRIIVEKRELYEEGV